jgi:hypothetical protein
MVGDGRFSSPPAPGRAVSGEDASLGGVLRGGPRTPGARMRDGPVVAWTPAIGRGRDHGLRWSPSLVSCVAAGVLGWLAIVLRWRGGDWPAQLYRINLFRRVGFTQWDNQWYGGHHTPAYSSLLPPLGAWLGPGLLAVASAVVATWGVARLAQRFLPWPMAASVVFGVSTVTNVAIGRLTFSLGVAIGVSAVVAMVTDRRVVAIVLALATPLGSPVAGAFLAIAGTAWWLSHFRQRIGLFVAIAATAPILVLAVAFPEGGRFPLSLEDASITVVVAVAAAITLPRQYTAVRIGAALYAASAIAVFVIPNPIGANLTRLAVYAGPPIVVGVLWRSRRIVATAILVPLAVWQWGPALDAIFTAGRDPSSHASYYDGLLRELDALPPSRVEIPFTSHHWEANFVAPHAALARGWERQLDIETNPIFYDSDVPLTAATYEQWLRDHAVDYVALADVDLDDSAVAEAALIRGGLPSLVPIWSDPDWRVFAVTDPTPLVTGPATLAALDTSSFTVRVDSPGDVLVRIRYTSHWDVDGPGCATESADGWTLVRFTEAGTWKVRQVVSPWIVLQPQRDDKCPSEP